MFGSIFQAKILQSTLFVAYQILAFSLSNFFLINAISDMSTLTSDLPTLLGVSTGIAVLAGLICMVLHLFTKTKYPRHRHFNDNNLPPPIMYSSDTGEKETFLMHDIFE